MKESWIEREKIDRMREWKKDGYIDIKREREREREREIRGEREWENEKR